MIAQIAPAIDRAGLIRAERLGARIDDRAGRSRPADDRGEDRECTIVERAPAQPNLVAVGKDVRARPQFSDARHVADIRRRRGAADAHLRDLEAVRTQRLGDLDKAGSILHGGIVPPTLGLTIHLAGKAHDTDELDSSEACDFPCERPRLLGRLHAAASKPCVDLDPDWNRQPAGGRRLRDALEHLVGVRADADVGGGGEFTQALPLASSPDGVGDKEVAYPMPGEELCFSQLCDGEAGAAGGQLALGDGEKLVGLGMRPQGDARVGGESCHPLNVPVQPGEVEDESGCVELGLLDADLVRGVRPAATWLHHDTGDDISLSTV